MVPYLIDILATHRAITTLSGGRQRRRLSWHKANRRFNRRECQGDCVTSGATESATALKGAFEFYARKGSTSSPHRRNTKPSSTPLIGLSVRARRSWLEVGDDGFIDPQSSRLPSALAFWSRSCTATTRSEPLTPSLNMALSVRSGCAVPYRRRSDRGQGAHRRQRHGDRHAFHVRSQNVRAEGDGALYVRRKKTTGSHRPSRSRRASEVCGRVQPVHQIVGLGKARSCADLSLRATLRRRPRCVIAPRQDWLGCRDSHQRQPGKLFARQPQHQLHFCRGRVVLRATRRCGVQWLCVC